MPIKKQKAKVALNMALPQSHLCSQTWVQLSYCNQMRQSVERDIKKRVRNFNANQVQMLFVFRGFQNQSASMQVVKTPYLSPFRTPPLGLFQGEQV